MKKYLVNNPGFRFSRGFFYPFKAGKFLLRHPSLLRFVVVPFLINVFLFSGLVYYGVQFFDQFVAGLIPSGEAWYWVIIFYSLWVIAVAVTAVLIFFTFSVVGNLIASPFNDLLSNKTEELILGLKTDEKFSLQQFWSDSLQILLIELKKISIFVGIMLILFLLNFLPGIGSMLFSILAFLLTVFFLVLEYFGFVAYRKRLDFREQRKFIWSRFSMTFGFGIGIMALLTLPLLNFICIPLGVVGATLMWCETTDDTVNPPTEKVGVGD
ncbi:MAG: sulfate transporter CysZ [Deltaproteobacteria bacterium]|nr:sulfate transporter CysZ [Deltaproteobacteria bacterium]